MNRTDVCPSCGTKLRYEQPDIMMCGAWVCPRCHYRRREGSCMTDPLYKYFHGRKKK